MLKCSLIHSRRGIAALPAEIRPARAGLYLCRCIKRDFQSLELRKHPRVSLGLRFQRRLHLVAFLAWSAWLVSLQAHAAKRGWLTVGACIELQLQPFVSLAGAQNFADVILELDEGVIIGRAVVRELKPVTPAQDAAPSEITPHEVIVDGVTVRY